LGIFSLPILRRMEGILSQKIPKKFRCECCYYYTSNKKDYEKHLLTSKHQKVLDGSNVEVMEVNKIPIYTCECSKTFKTHGGLWKHKAKGCCVNNTNLVNNDTESDVKNGNNNSSDKDELINYLIKENQEFKNMILEIVQKDSYNQSTTNTHSHSHNNNNNKTFNLNFFLNETCKDAMNMKDFIKSLEMSLPELEKMGEVGFAEGMSRVFVDRLNQLDVTKRPIHCSDVKREIIHIKDDNKWEKDNANMDRLRKIIKQLTIKNILRVDDWKKANQGCTEYNSRKNEQYLRINMEAIGPVDDAETNRDFGKIIRRLAESTTIDKNYL
jgi:hypothetical protein